MAETVNGEIVLERVDATSLDASTVNGDVGYDGPIRSGGRYALSSHNGDMTLAVAEGTSAAVSVTTFNGEFESEFPVTLRETRKGKRFNFTLGAGRAQVSLESFQGTVSAGAAGSAPAVERGRPRPRARPRPGSRSGPLTRRARRRMSHFDRMRPGASRRLRGEVEVDSQSCRAAGTFFPPR